jgi:MoxR-like ATPase
METAPTTETEQGSLQHLIDALDRVIRGQARATELMLIGLLSGGHVLIEDVPGVGKTTLATALAQVLSLDFRRVQCTPDLLPSDILGSNILDPRDGSLTFHEGPIFTQVLLVDETNRASPRTQSGLLEAMNERQVTVDGVTRPLATPFFVIATQNPVDHQGTYALPIAQLDRFLVRVSMGYPEEDDELSVLFDRQSGDPLDALGTLADVQQVRDWQSQVMEVTVSDDVARYLLQLVRSTRDHPDIALGISTRGALGLFRASQARAFIRGRSYITPKDVQSLAASVLAHRLTLTARAKQAGRGAIELVEELVESQTVPV